MFACRPINRNQTRQIIDLFGDRIESRVKRPSVRAERRTSVASACFRQLFRFAACRRNQKQMHRCLSKCRVCAVGGCCKDNRFAVRSPGRRDLIVCASDRAAKTALEVFPDCALLLNNILASNAPLKFNKDRWRNTLASYNYNGKPLFDLNTESGSTDLESIVSILDTINVKDIPTERRLWTKEVLEKEPGVIKARPITDDNLGHEFWYH